MTLPTKFLLFENVLKQKGISFDNKARFVDTNTSEQLKKEIAKKLLPHKEIPFNRNKIIYTRFEVNQGLRTFLASKFKDYDSWINHADTMTDKFRELSIPAYCDWFINESFNRIDLRLLNDGHILVIDGNHRIALLDVLGYSGTLDTKYFFLQND